MIIVYGITNCHTVQKALQWLNAHSITYTFHDYKKIGIDREHLETWCNHFGWEKVLNRSGMMWRKAPEDQKALVVNQHTATDFMINTPNSIKRPIIETPADLIIGFDEDEYITKLTYLQDKD